MTITSSCKKMMAFVIAFALVLSVLFIPGKVASAAEGDTPSVKVLGATIRLAANDNNGTQSMRIGIQVDNANKANACAIQLTVNGVTYTVATKADKGDVVQPKMHSKDVENNSVVYAVVLTNIPESAYYSTIRIVGKAWDANDVEYVSAPTEKNVIGVVDTIKSKYPGLNICILNGSLYKDAGTSKLTAEDLAGYSDNPDPSVTGNPVATPAPTREPAGADEWAVPFERINENAEGQIFYAVPDPNHQACARTYDRYADELLITNETTDGNADGLTVNLPAEEVAKRYTKVTVNYEYVGEGDGLFGYKYRKSDGSEYFNFNDMGSHQFSRSETSKEISINSGYVPVEKFYIICFSTGISIRIKSIIFSDPKPDYSGNVDLSSATVNGNAITNTGNTTYDNGVISVNETGSDSTELIFNLPNGGTVDEGESVAVAVTGSCTVPDFTGFRVRLANADGGQAGDWCTPYTAATSREFSEVFTISATALASKLALKSRSYDSGPIAGLTITSISVHWIGRDAVAPTAMPSPTPVPASPYAPALSTLTWWSNDTVTVTDDPNGQKIVTKSGSDGEFGFALPSSELSNQYDTVTIYFADGTMSGNLGVVEHYNTTTIGWQSGEKNSARISLNGSGVATINGDSGNCLSALRFYNVPQGSVRIESVVFSSSTSSEPIPTPAPTPEPTATPEPTEVPVFYQVNDITDGVYVLRLADSVTPGGGIASGTSGNYIVTETAVNENFLDYNTFDTAASDTTGVSLWKIERIAKMTNSDIKDKYLIRNMAISDESVAYLNLSKDTNKACLGPRQEIDISGSGSSIKIQVGSRYLRFSNSGGNGFTSGTNTNSSNFSLFRVRDDVAPSLPAASAVPAYDATGALPASSAVAWKVNTPIVADGTIDAAWDSVPYYTIANYGSAAGTTQALGKIAWDEKNLYALVRVNDPSFDSTNSNNWNRDGGELYLDEDNSGQEAYGGDDDANTDAFQYRLTGFDSDDQYCNEISKGTSATRTLYAGICAAPKFVDDGYILEYKIPWASASAAVEGKQIGFELVVMDCEGGSRTQEIHMFATEGDSLYSHADRFGKISLADDSGAVPAPTPEPKTWNDNYPTQAKYELVTLSGTTDKALLGKEVIFVGKDGDGKAYAMSANGSTITTTDIDDYYFGDTLYIPKNYNLNNISWSTMWNKANGSVPDMGTGYLFQNLEDERYLGVNGVELTAQGVPTGMTDSAINYKKNFSWTSELNSYWYATNYINFDGTDFDSDATARSNVLCYVKSYTGDHAVKNTWHQVDHFTTGRDYLLVTSNTPGTARAFYMTGTGNSDYDGKDVTINSDGTITYDAAYNDAAVVNAHSLSEGTFYLNTWIDPTVRQTLSYNGDASADRSLYVTSDNSLSTYAFRFAYINGALKVYHGSSGFNTEMPVRWRTRSSGALGIGSASNCTNEFYIFERDVTPQDYAQTERAYSRVTDLSQIQDGDKVLMIFDGHATGIDLTPEFMIPEGIEINNRIGFNIQSTEIAMSGNIYGDAYEDYEWTFTRSGSGWIVGTSAGEVKFTAVDGKGVTATLETSGDVLTVSGSSVYSFYAGDYCFNRNTSRSLINAYAGQEAHFYLYKYVG